MSEAIFELAKDVAKLALIAGAVFLALGAYARRMQPAWSAPIAKHRLAILTALVLAATAIKVSEDVIGAESGPIDEAILRFIHAHVPTTLTGFFAIVTLSASAQALVPLTLVATIALLVAGRRGEALLVASSTASAAVVVYVVKTLVDRDRPALWDTQWYWGSSFPSGHTLVVAAFATAGALCVGRMAPAWRSFALIAAAVWIVLVALSRLVLGVHWPTDVLTAACVGAFLPLVIGVALGWWSATPAVMQP